MKQQVWDVIVIAQGIKKGCRKTDNHLFDLIKVPDTGGDFVFTDEILNKAKSLVVSEMKAAHKVRIKARPMEIDGGILYFALCSPRCFEHTLGAS